MPFNGMISHPDDGRHAFFGNLLRTFLLLGCMAQLPSVFATPPLPLLLEKGIEFIVNYLASKTLDVVVDYALSEIERRNGAGLERQLADHNQHLLNQLRHSNPEDRDNIQLQLDLAQSELRSIREILYSKLGPEEMVRLESRIKEDMYRLSAIVASHDTRLGYVETNVRALQRRLQELEKKLVTRPEGTAAALRIGGYLVRILRFGTQNSSVPRSLHVAAPELLASKLSHNGRGNVKAESVKVSELLINGALLRYSVERRPYAGYGVRTLSQLHTLQLSVQLLNANGTQTYLAKSYQRQKKETSLDGRNYTESDGAIAYELLGELLDTVAADILDFLSVR